MEVVRGLRQAAIMVLGSVLVAAAGAGVWLALADDGGFRTRFAVALMVIAAMLGLTGGSALSRSTTSDTRAFLGEGPDREDPDSGAALTAVGVFLFVSVPLFVGGGLLFGTG